MPDKMLQTPEGAGGRFSDGLELLSKALKTVFVILAAVIVALIVWFLTCGGSFIVDSTAESVIVLKFGRYYGEYKEGWHWFLPYPVNRIVRVPTRKETIVSSRFLPSNAARLRDPSAKSLTGRDESTSLTPGVDGYALLADNSIMHSEWVLTFRIGSPEQFYRSCMSREVAALPEASDKYSGTKAETLKLDTIGAMLKTLLDDAVIEAGATLTLDDTYYNPDRYLQAVRSLLLKRIEALNAGVVMENLSLSLIAPPLQTQAAFQEFLLAKTMAEREVESARTYRVEQENQAFSESEQIISAGELQKQKIVSNTRADAGYFKKILAEYEKNPEATLVSLYAANLAKSLALVQEKYVISTDPGSTSEVRLRLNREPEKRKGTGTEDIAGEKTEARP